MQPLAQRLAGKARFVNVYILEAHPLDGWTLPVNDDDGVCVRTPRTLPERLALMRRLVDEFGVDPVAMPFVADDLDNAIELAFEARPERLYLIVDGCVRWRSGIGPYCYNVPALERELDLLLS